MEMRREHRRWGAKRTRLELLRKPVEGVTAPSTATVNRILRRKGLVIPRPRKKPKSAYVRFVRPGPMQLSRIEIVGGIQLSQDIGSTPGAESPFVYAAAYCAHAR